MSTSRIPDTQRLAVATGYSQVESRRTYHSNIDLNFNYENLDVFRASIHQFGLPVAVIIDGHSCEFIDNGATQALASRVVNALVELVDKLHNQKIAESDIKGEIKNIYANLFNIQKGKSNSIINAAMSAFALYRNKSGELKIIGFGSGETLALIKEKQHITTLIAPNTHKNQNLFASLTTSEAEAILNALTIVDQPANEQQNLIVMTDGVYQPVFKLNNGLLISNAENIALLKTNILQLADANEAASLATKVNAAPEKMHTSGGDATVGRINIKAAVAIEKPDKTPSFWQQYGQTILIIGAGVTLGLVGMAFGLIFLPGLLVLLPAIGTAAAALSAAFGFTITANALLTSLVAGVAVIIGTLTAGSIDAIVSRSAQTDPHQHADNTSVTSVGMNSAGILLTVGGDKEYLGDLVITTEPDNTSDTTTLEFGTLSRIDVDNIPETTVEDEVENDPTPKMDMS